LASGLNIPAKEFGRPLYTSLIKVSDSESVIQTDVSAYLSKGAGSKISSEHDTIKINSVNKMCDFFILILFS
jgi:hypothetical protein